jgi:hypothetical protein
MIREALALTRPAFDLTGHLTRSAEVTAFDLTVHMRQRQTINLLRSTCAKLRMAREEVAA